MKENKQDAVSSAVRNGKIGYLPRLPQETLDVLEQGMDGNRVTGITWETLLRRSSIQITLIADLTLLEHTTLIADLTLLEHTTPPSE